MKRLFLVPLLGATLLLGGCFGLGGSAVPPALSDLIKNVQAQTAQFCKFVPDASVITAIVNALSGTIGAGSIVGAVVDIICPLDQKLSVGRSARPKSVVVNNRSIRVTGKRVR